MNTLEMFDECIKNSLTLEKMKVIIVTFKEHLPGIASIKLSLVTAIKFTDCKAAWVKKVWIKRDSHISVIR